MWHVLYGVEVRIVRGNFDAAAPAARAVEHPGAGVRDVHAIDVQLVVMEAFILCIRNARPVTVRVFAHRVPDTTHIKLHALGVGSPQTRANPPLRIDPGLSVDNSVQGGGLKIFYRRSLIDLDGRSRPTTSLSALARNRTLRRLGSCGETRFENVLTEKVQVVFPLGGVGGIDRKSTRLN